MEDTKGGNNKQKRMAGDFDGSISKMEDTKGGNNKQKRGWNKHKNGLFKDKSKIEAIPAFRRDEGAKGGVDGWSTISSVHFGHFEERVEDGKRREKRVRGNKGALIYLVQVVVVNNNTATDNRRNRKVVIQLRIGCKQNNNKIIN